MNKKIKMFLVATNVVASRPPERRPTATPTARTNYQKTKKSKQDEVALTSKPCYFKLNKIILCKVSLVQNLSSPAGLEVAR